MTLLIITQRVDKNNDVLGFFHRWIEELAKQVGEVFVIAQFIGEYDLPKNVEVFSLGKEKGNSKIYQFFNFYKLLFKILPKIDAVFVHMIPLWVVLGWPVFKIFRKKVYLWYVHKTVNFMLWLAEKSVSKIFTASAEGCRLKSNKIVITGHGIDIDKFQIRNSKHIPHSTFHILSVGRIAPVKNYEVLIEAGEILKNKNFSAKGGPASGWEIKLAGQPILENDKVYFEKLKKLIKEKGLADKISFVGSVPYKDVAEFYQSGDLFVNFSDTGSMDKAVLEAMASGLLILTSNEAFKNILPEKYFTSKNPEEVAGKIIALSKAAIFDPALRECVVKNHGLENLIEKLLTQMNVQ